MFRTSNMKKRDTEINMIKKIGLRVEYTSSMNFAVKSKAYDQDEDILGSAI